MSTFLTQNKVLLLVIFFILVCLTIIVLVLTGTTQNHTAMTPPAPTAIPQTATVPQSVTLFNDGDAMTAPQDSNYTLADSATAPKRTVSAMQGTLSRKTAVSEGHTWEQFVINNTTDNLDRVLFNHAADNTTFEPISKANWSPNNRFVFVYFKTPAKRDVLFMQTDGRFTSTQYYLHPTERLQNETVTDTYWKNEDIAIVETKDMTTNQQKLYAAEFDDSVGSIVEITPNP
jgi:hypothetical protein